MVIEEIFGTLQQSVVDSWRKHLTTSKYSAHKALQEFYDEMPDLVDKLIEDYIGIKGEKIERYDSLIKASELEVVDYFRKLRTICKTGRTMLGRETELESDMDEILSLIDSTIYKLEQLTENKSPRSLKDYIKESIR